LLDQFPDRSRENLEANFGLLRNNFSEKPAFKAVKHLIALLRDPGPAFKPGALDYSVEGAPPTLRQMLLQKRDGTFYLALWNEVSVWDPAAGKALPASSAPVRLRFGEPVRSVEVYRPSSSGRALQRRGAARALKLRASAGVAVVKITPRSTRTASFLPCAGRRGSPGWLAAVSCRLKGDERRALITLTHLRSQRPMTSHSRRRAARLEHWLRRRARKIRPHITRPGGAGEARRVRYRAIRRGLRIA
jgi:hypothetical protein